VFFLPQPAASTARTPASKSAVYAAAFFIFLKKIPLYVLCDEIRHFAFPLPQLRFRQLPGAFCTAVSVTALSH
jgi:hypothetical protein